MRSIESRRAGRVDRFDCTRFSARGCTPGIPWVCRSSSGGSSSSATRGRTPRTSRALCNSTPASPPSAFCPGRRTPRGVSSLARRSPRAPREEVVRRAGDLARARRASAEARAVVHHRPPLVVARRALPQRLVIRPPHHLCRLSVPVDVLLQEFLPSLAVLFAPHEEVVGWSGGDRTAPGWAALRTSGGFVALRAVVHRRPPLVAARRALPQCSVARPPRHLRRSPVRVDVLLQESSLKVLLAPRDEVVGRGIAPPAVVRRRARRRRASNPRESAPHAAHQRRRRVRPPWRRRERDACHGARAEVTKALR